MEKARAITNTLIMKAKSPPTKRRAPSLSIFLTQIQEAGETQNSLNTIQ